MTNKEIGHRIQEIRSEKGITREHLANHADISSKFLYEIESGKKGLSAKTLFKIAQVLNCSCDYLLTGDDSSFPQSNPVLEQILKLDPKHTHNIIKIIKLIYEISVNE